MSCASKFKKYGKMQIVAHIVLSTWKKYLSKKFGTSTMQLEENRTLKKDLTKESLQLIQGLLFLFL